MRAAGAGEPRRSERAARARGEGDGRRPGAQPGGRGGGAGPGASAPCSVLPLARKGLRFSRSRRAPRHAQAARRSGASRAHLKQTRGFRGVSVCFLVRFAFFVFLFLLPSFFFSERFFQEVLRKKKPHFAEFVSETRVQRVWTAPRSADHEGRGRRGSRRGGEERAGRVDPVGPVGAAPSPSRPRLSSMSRTPPAAGRGGRLHGGHGTWFLVHLF